MVELLGVDDLPKDTEIRYRCYLCGQESVLPVFVTTHECPKIAAPPTPVIVSFYPAHGTVPDTGPPPKIEVQPYERRG